MLWLRQGRARIKAGIKVGIVTLAVGEGEGRGTEQEKAGRPRENSGICPRWDLLSRETYTWKSGLLGTEEDASPFVADAK